MVRFVGGHQIFSLMNCINTFVFYIDHVRYSLILVHRLVCYHYPNRILHVYVGGIHLMCNDEFILLVSITIYVCFFINIWPIYKAQSNVDR